MLFDPKPYFPDCGGGRPCFSPEPWKWLFVLAPTPAAVGSYKGPGAEAHTLIGKPLVFFNVSHTIDPSVRVSYSLRLRPA